LLLLWVLGKLLFMGESMFVWWIMRGMKDFQVPTLEQMAEELRAGGWRQKTPVIWQSPKGKLFLGPYGAWKIMKSCGDSPEFVQRTVTERP